MFQLLYKLFSVLIFCAPQKAAVPNEPQAFDNS
jgi:hypothetical protein